MAILLLITFAGVFLTLGVRQPNSNKRSLLLQSVLLFSLLVVITTEVLSLVAFINVWAIMLVWAVVGAGHIRYLFKQREQLNTFVKNLRSDVKLKLTTLSLSQKVMLGALAVLLLLVFAQGIIYPPNNRDSLTYHMGRIPAWIGQHSVEHFPTHIVRQLYQPPFAEYLIMHINLLNFSDYLSSSVQFVYLVWAMIAVTLIIKAMGLGSRWQVAGCILAATIPEVLLQASSTQNDIVVAAFVLTAFYFMLKAIKEPTLKNYAWFGLAVGLSLFTKGTAYMYLAPVLLIFGIDVLVKVFRERKLHYIYSGLLTAALLPVLINIGHYSRNYGFSGNFLGVDHEESRIYKNESMSVRYFVVNAVKNADLHMGVLGVPHITLLANKAVRKFSNAVHVNLNDPAITIPGTSGIPGDMLWAYFYGGMTATHDDYAPNFFHFFLILIGLIITLATLTTRKAGSSVMLLLVAVVLQVVVFVLYLKWQSLGTRLHTTIFLMALPLVCYAAGVSGLFRKVTAVMLPVILFYGYLVVVFNFGRPLIKYDAMVAGFRITRPISVSDNRYQKYFSLITEKATYPEYAEVLNEVKRLGYKNIGFISGYNDWEYPLFKDCYSRPLNPVHLYVNNYSKNIPLKESNVDCIVATNTNKLYIDYKGKRYVNRDASHKTIFLYTTSN
ncbi:hypothetical protein DJ568_07755 [Mucilaginibacter hurinus]|uniref:Glycosyltransferase RgtA/B/C/D-like domain-containing protein n=1 Tax=Mucilaginibacter hurinus TaxID=2201324 RepID=A0A367GNN7_9SPHI|nr:glycosyltransferase family 39 protein [Mucilaginibacter hurinus]RCH55079.1 hypothetical protein DJ568_07755 [Mucilaginibacter hurinus]